MLVLGSPPHLDHLFLDIFLILLLKMNHIFPNYLQNHHLQVHISVSHDNYGSVV